VCLYEYCNTFSIRTSLIWCTVHQKITRVWPRMAFCGTENVCQTCVRRSGWMGKCWSRPLKWRMDYLKVVRPLLVKRIKSDDIPTIIFQHKLMLELNIVLRHAVMWIYKDIILCWQLLVVISCQFMYCINVAYSPNGPAHGWNSMKGQTVVAVR